MCWCPSEIRASATGPAFPATALLYIDPSREGLTSFFTLCVCVCALAGCVWWRSQDRKKNKKGWPPDTFIYFIRPPAMKCHYNTASFFYYTHKSLFFRYFSGFHFYSTPLIFFFSFQVDKFSFIRISRKMLFFFLPFYWKMFETNRSV